MPQLVSEDHILALIDRFFPNAPLGKEEGAGHGGRHHVLLGRGDDCAVLSGVDPLCVSTDLFMEDVHFRRSYCTPEEIGWKALAVNLSDLAACGARPVGFTVGLALPPDADVALVEGLCSGMAALAEEHDVPLIGGDISRAERLHLCLTVLGQPEATLLRGRACVGDVLFLVGRIGLARAGLALLEEQGREAMQAWPALCDAHLRPVPRMREGLRLSRLAASWAVESGDPLCGRLGLMDVSDGLARDLPRLLNTARTGYGADVRIAAPAPELIRFMTAQGAAQPLEAALQHAFAGGEDYALLGTCDPAFAAQVMVTVAEASVLGVVTDDGVLRLNGQEQSGGFDHFASAQH